MATYNKITPTGYDNLEWLNCSETTNGYANASNGIVRKLDDTHIVVLKTVLDSNGSQSYINISLYAMTHTVSGGMDFNMLILDKLVFHDAAHPYYYKNLDADIDYTNKHINLIWTLSGGSPGFTQSTMAQISYDNYTLSLVFMGNNIFTAAPDHLDIYSSILTYSSDTILTGTPDNPSGYILNSNKIDDSTSYTSTGLLSRNMSNLYGGAFPIIKLADGNYCFAYSGNYGNGDIYTNISTRSLTTEFNSYHNTNSMPMLTVLNDTTILYSYYSNSETRYNLDILSYDSSNNTLLTVLTKSIWETSAVADYKGISVARIDNNNFIVSFIIAGERLHTDLYHYENEILTKTAQFLITDNNSSYNLTQPEVIILNSTDFLVIVSMEQTATNYYGDHNILYHYSYGNSATTANCGIKISIGDEWKDINNSGLKMNIGGAYKNIKKMKIAIGGQWHTAFMYPMDTTPPSDVTNLTASNETANSITLNWDIATDNDVVSGYDIYMNGDYYTNVSTNTAIISGLKQSTSYTFKVKAKDDCINESINFSNEVTASTLTYPIGFMITEFHADDKYVGVTLNSTNLYFSLIPLDAGSGNYNILLSKNGTQIDSKTGVLFTNDDLYNGVFTLSVAADYGDEYLVHITSES